MFFGNSKQNLYVYRSPYHLHRSFFAAFNTETKRFRLLLPVDRKKQKKLFIIPSNLVKISIVSILLGCASLSAESSRLWQHSASRLKELFCNGSIMSFELNYGFSALSGINIGYRTSQGNMCLRNIFMVVVKAPKISRFFFFSFFFLPSFFFSFHQNCTSTHLETKVTRTTVSRRYHTKIKMYLDLTCKVLQPQLSKTWPADQRTPLLFHTCVFGIWTS